MARGLEGTGGEGGAPSLPRLLMESQFAALGVPPVPSRVWRALRSSLLFLVADLIATFVALVAYDRTDLLTLIYPLILVCWLGLLGSYKSRVAPSIQVDMVPLLGAVACPMLVLTWIHTSEADRLLRDIPVAAGALIVGRFLVYPLQRVVRSHRAAADRTLIVGSGMLGCEIAQVLLEHHEYGLMPVGFVDGFPDDVSLPLPILGNIEDFDSVVRQSGARRVVIAFGANRETELVAVLRASVEAHVQVHIIPRLFELGVTPSGPDADIVWGFPLQHARRAALRTPAWRTKRILDVIVSGFALFLLSPILAVAALAVRFSGPGGILFRQRRLGQRGEVVEIYKFRSMTQNADSDTQWGLAGDNRVTKVGRILRLTGVDELPQLVNVLKGDMSLVGPRPERPHFADQFDVQIVRYKDRLRVPVGLTGWAQIHGLRGDTSIEERARFDNYYIEHWTLWFDLVILARTVTYVLKEVARKARSRPKR